MHKSNFYIALDKGAKREVSGYIDSLILPDGEEWTVAYWKRGKMWQAVDYRSGWMLTEEATRKACAEWCIRHADLFYRTFKETPEKREAYRIKYINALENAKAV